MVLTEEDVARAQIEQGQQGLDNDPASVHADVLREDRVANLLDQLNPDNLMVDIEHRIRGEKKDPYTNRWVPIAGNSKPVSEKLISNFMSFLGSILNQNTAMSNFSSDEINNLMMMIVTYVGIDLTVNDEEYGIVEDYPEMWRIANIVCITCFATFKQAMNGMQSRRVFGGLKINASLTEDKKPGVKDAFAFWN